MPASVFIVHAPADAPARRSLEYALAYLVEPRPPGAEIDRDHQYVEPPLTVSTADFDRASVVIVLLSPAWEASAEAQAMTRRALDRRRAGLTQVVAVCVHACDVPLAALDDIRILPRNDDGRVTPIDPGPPDSAAWVAVARSLEPLLRERAFSSVHGAPSPAAAHMPPAAPLPGSETLFLGRYRAGQHLRRELAGDVFAADDQRGRRVSLKVRRPGAPAEEAADRARFAREVDVLSTLRSAHVPHVYDFGDEPGHGPVIVLEELPGESWRARLGREGAAPLVVVHPIFEQLLGALVDIHAAGILHRHVSLSTIWLGARPNGDPRVTLCDFGGCVRPGREDDRADTVYQAGFFAYSAPETIGGWSSLEPSADLYSAATCLYAALAGRMPFEARNVLQMVEMKTRTEPPRLAEVTGANVSPAVEIFLSRALARSPEHRFPSAEAARSAWRLLR